MLSCDGFIENNCLSGLANREAICIASGRVGAPRKASSLGEGRVERRAKLTADTTRLNTTVALSAYLINSLYVDLKVTARHRDMHCSH
ncbi:hypothetical protein EMIT0373P_70284 [Pseudomonas chlororaphis]